MFYLIFIPTIHNLQHISPVYFYIFYLETLSSYLINFKLPYFLIISFYLIDKLPVQLDLKYQRLYKE
jgi:hypothetical protein